MDAIMWVHVRCQMKVQRLTGSKQEITEKVAGIEGDFREAIVFVDEPTNDAPHANLFAEMEPYTVQQPQVDDSRQTLYRKMESE